jgi:hypothetical protein
MIDQWRTCPASTQLTAAELARLVALPAPVNPVVRFLICELVAGHDGCHTALTVTASGGERWWWLRWPPESRWAPELRELVVADTCDGMGTGNEWAEWCLLPHGHPGPHSFEIGADSVSQF